MVKPGLIDLGARGLDYVREHLTGANPFCTALAATVDAAPGRALTLPVEGQSLERLYRFNEGGLLAPVGNVVRLSDGSTLEEKPSLNVEQAAYLISLLRLAPESACIVDDFNPRWTEIDLEYYPFAFGVEDDVYHLLTAADPAQGLMDALAVSNVTWHGVAAICVDVPELDESRECSVEALQAAAASVIALTCVAYDGEGFVIWRRD